MSEEGLRTLRTLNEIARQRGQTLAQLAIQWTLRDPVVASALIGASRPSQIDENIAAVTAPPLTDEELTQIDAVAGTMRVNLWAVSSEL